MIGIACEKFSCSEKNVRLHQSEVFNTNEKLIWFLVENRLYHFVSIRLFFPILKFPEYSLFSDEGDTLSIISSALELSIDLGFSWSITDPFSSVTVIDMLLTVSDNSDESGPRDSVSWGSENSSKSGSTNVEVGMLFSGLGLEGSLEKSRVLS